MTSPAVKLRFDATGRLIPSGNTVTSPDDVGLTAVTFSTTAVTPVDGTPSFPVTCRLTVLFGPTGPVTPPVPYRVSISRTGPAGTYRPDGTSAHRPTSTSAPCPHPIRPLHLPCHPPVPP